MRSFRCYEKKAEGVLKGTANTSSNGRVTVNLIKSTSRLFSRKTDIGKGTNLPMLYKRLDNGKLLANGLTDDSTNIKDRATLIEMAVFFS